jgi:hypothetical protein
MRMLTVSYADESQTPALMAAIAQIAPDAHVASYLAAPSAPGEQTMDEILDADLKERAREVVDLIRPDKNTSRARFLYQILIGRNSWEMSSGDALASPRWEAMAVSKTLKKRYGWLRSPIDVIVTRRRIYFEDGSYKGIKYEPTDLGLEVLSILKAEKLI